MSIKVRVTPAIAKRGGWTGTRRRTVTKADGSKETFTFGRKAIVIEEEYPEIMADEQLIKESVGAASVQIVDDGAHDTKMVEPPSLPADLSALPIAEVRKHAEARGLETSGNKAQIISRLTKAAAAVADPIPADDEQGG